MNNSRIKEIQKSLRDSIYNRSTYLFTLVDRSPSSKTYGCFDRSYWQYKIKDFASGMSQEAVYPLSLALESNIFENISTKSKENLKDIIFNGIEYSLENQHENGSVDDYYPFEQASGATAFTTYAILCCIEIDQISLSAKQLLKLRKRINWLYRKKESGRLSNHEALICLVLAKASQILDDMNLYTQSVERTFSLLNWRDDEGWFEEYNGLDIGYETLTFSCLLQLQEILDNVDINLYQVINKQAEFIINSIEPDGCFGGELYSRGTWNCFAHGILSYSIRNNYRIDRVLKLIESIYLTYPIEIKDDYIIQHHLWSDILTYKILDKYKHDKKIETNYYSCVDKFMEKRIAYYPNSGHIWIQHGSAITHISIKMGGLFRLYKNEKFIFQDTQNILKVKKDIFSSNILNNEINFKWENNNKLVIEGYMVNNSPSLMTTNKLLFLRLIMISFGKYVPNLIRAFMQKVLIYSKFNKRRKFSRIFIFSNDCLKVVDKYRVFNSELYSSEVIETSFSTFRHVVMSRVFHPYNLLLHKPTVSSIDYKDKFIQFTRHWDSIS